MKLSHKILYCIATFYLSVGSTIAFGVEPETQTIIDNANSLEQKYQAATGPQTNYFSSDLQAVITVNGIDIQGIPCNAAPIPVEWQSSHPYCYVLVR